jgi:transcriptional regulator with XRE-family HTH domain
MVPGMTTRSTRGSTIRALRNERGLSQGSLARAIGIETQGTISNWENDKVEIDASHLLKLVEFFGVEPDVLGYELPYTTPGGDMPAWAGEIHRKLDEILSRLHDLEHQR